jgi:hypothetical protein
MSLPRRWRVSARASPACGFNRSSMTTRCPEISRCLDQAWRLAVGHRPGAPRSDSRSVPPTAGGDPCAIIRA